MEDFEIAYAGDIVAMFGIDCASGDTFTHEGTNASMQSMFVPEAVISLAIAPKTRVLLTISQRLFKKIPQRGPHFPRSS